MSRWLVMLASILTTGLAWAQSSGCDYFVQYDGVIIDRFNRWDGYPTHVYTGGKHKFYWCSEKNFADHIYFTQKNSPLSNPSSGFTAYSSVLSRDDVVWADLHVCDPAIIMGSFSYQGQNYNRALYFTSDLGSQGGSENEIGVAFANDDSNWTVYPNSVIQTLNPPNGGYGAGMSGVGREGSMIVHSYLDSTMNPDYVVAKDSFDGINFVPTPPMQTSLAAAGRHGRGQGPDIAMDMTINQSRWVAVIKSEDDQNRFDGETRLLWSETGLNGTWNLEQIFDYRISGFPQNHNPGLAKNEDGSLYTDSNGWHYLFFTVGLERPDVDTWAVAQARFRDLCWISQPLQAPAINSPQGYSPTNPPTIEWEPVFGARNYRLWVYDWWTGNLVHARTVNGATTSYTLPSALGASPSYRFRMKTRNQNGDYGDYSDYEYFSFEEGTPPNNLLPPPSTLQPSGFTSDSTPELTWTAVNGARKYRLEVRTSAGSLVQAKTVNPMPTSWSTTTTLSPGNYKWRVKTWNASGQYGTWSAYRSFTVQ